MWAPPRSLHSTRDAALHGDGDWPRFAVESVTARRDDNHARWSVHSFIREALVPLNGFEVFAQVLDPLSDSRFIVVLQVLENGAPHGHLGRAMCGKAETEA